MKADPRYYHAILTDPASCDGCMKCLRTCPTEALRVRNETPVISEDLCIDCGACIAACPRNAVRPDVDTFKETGAYKIRIAVPSPVLYSQFGLETSPKEIHLALHKLGFHYIYDVNAACEIEALAVQAHLQRVGDSARKPFISSMCPAVVRLIQVKYPTLVDRVLPFEPPRELSAREAKINVAKKLGLEIKDVGAFYISPCPAKSISVLQPAEKKHSFLDAVVAISDIFVPLHKAIGELGRDEIDSYPEEKNVFGSGWDRGGLLSRNLNIKNWIAVSGLQHVSGILDNIEEGKLDSVAFVEAHACLEGCVGGSLCVENISVARSKTLILERDHGSVPKMDPNWVHQLYDSGYFFMENELQPRPMKEPSPSISDAIVLMKKRDELAARLPAIDCCACGSPSCVAFAEDVVTNRAKLDDCPYLKQGSDGKTVREDEAGQP